MIQGHNFGMWIGFRRKNYGNPWTWSDNSATEFINWGPREPLGTTVSSIPVVIVVVCTLKFISGHSQNGI